jgi:hypothetical protein
MVLLPVDNTPIMRYVLIKDAVMKIKFPSPISGGLILSYTCSSECRHCIYGCSPKWSSDWISEENLGKTMEQLSGRIIPSPYGPKGTTLSHGLHFTGGEPFLNFDLLCKASDIARKLRIPSTFVETNCFWATNDKVTKEKLRLLKSKGLHGIMISVNPFYLEYVPFERTERAIRIGLEVFNENVMVYQLEYYRQFMQWGIKDSVSFPDYLKIERKENFLQNTEFFMMGRAPSKLKEELKEILPLLPASFLFDESCIGSFIRNWHNHFDNYGNYVPGFCGGVSLGDCRSLDMILSEGIETEEYPVLNFLINEDMKGLFSFARNYGYQELEGGYFSKCHLCTDLRKFLVNKGEFKELTPKEFYLHLC